MHKQLIHCEGSISLRLEGLDSNEAFTGSVRWKKIDEESMHVMVFYNLISIMVFHSDFCGLESKCVLSWLSLHFR